MSAGNPTHPLGSTTLPQPIQIPRHTPPMGMGGKTEWSSGWMDLCVKGLGVGVV